MYANIFFMTETMQLISKKEYLISGDHNNLWGSFEFAVEVTLRRDLGQCC
jgi:hypothetical protein